MRLAVFTYDFPHRKTQDFLLRLASYGWRLSWDRGLKLIIISHAYENIAPHSGLRVKPRHTGTMKNERVFWTLVVGNCIRYVDKHDSADTISMLQLHEIDVGVIAGARILSGDVISAVRKGIINIHPGLIPEVRGSDSLKWAVYKGEKLGVTAHFIDERVDAGRIILRREIEVYPDDTWMDLSLRLEEIQPEVLIEALKLVEEKKEFPLVGEVGKANSYFPVELERKLDLEAWKRRIISQQT